MNKRAPEKLPDVEVDKGMPDDYDLCQDLKKEEFEGRFLALGRTSFDVTAMLSCRASSGLSNQCKVFSFAVLTERKSRGVVRPLPPCTILGKRLCLYVQGLKREPISFTSVCNCICTYFKFFHGLNRISFYCQPLSYRRGPWAKWSMQ